MPIDFRPATMSDLGIWVSIVGGSRTGKTVSALRLAKGLAGDAPVFAIDTEGRRMSHHAKRFKFNVFDMTSPFAPLRFAEAAESAQKAGAGALVCDSFSLEWNGPGGVLALHEAEHKRLGGQDKHSDAAWDYAKAIHREMRDRMMQLTVPMIFCSRCNLIDKRHAKGVEGRWKIEGDQRWLYEWTVQIPMRLPNVGRPCYDMHNKEGEPLWKVPEDLLALFPPDRFIGEAAGEGLRAWREGKPVVLRDETQPGEDKQRDGTARFIAKIAGAGSIKELDAMLHDQATIQWRLKLEASRPELEKDIKAAVRDAFERFRPEDGDEAGGGREAA